MLEQFHYLHTELTELKPTQFGFLTALVRALKIAVSSATNFELITVPRCAASWSSYKIANEANSALVGGVTLVLRQIGLVLNLSLLSCAPRGYKTPA